MNFWAKWMSSLKVLYKDVLLVAFLGVRGNDNESRMLIWALKDDRCIGVIDIDLNSRRMIAYKNNEIVNDKLLQETPVDIKLPKSDAGTWE
ncbi:MAG: hypothetical protein IBX64_07725 [Actinobacteria bacterium]|nr:hypothetical protein [Actinomycetota bacterium]